MKTPGIFYGVRAHDVWNLANHYLSTSFENTINYTCIAKDININCIICDMQNKHGRWFSSGTQAFSTTKNGCHDIAEILLKVALNTKNQINQNVYENRKNKTFQCKNKTKS
jgi:hypothetical protein